MDNISIKNINLVMFFIITIILIAFGVIDHMFHIQICALCHIERFLLVFLQFTFMLAFISYAKKKILLLLEMLSIFFSFLGIAGSSRLLWLYIYPHATINCSLPINKLLDHEIPIRGLITSIINGVGTCQSPQSIIPIASSLGALIVFIIAGFVAIYCMMNYKK